MKKITDEETLNYLPLVLQTMVYNENDSLKKEKLKKLEFAVNFYKTGRTLSQNFHRPISKII